MELVREGPDIPTADNVALPVHLPANAAGIVAPAASGGWVACVVCAGVLAALLAGAAAEVLPVAAGGGEGDPRVSRKTPTATRTATATAVPARTGPRRDGAEAGCGTGPWGGMLPGEVGPAGWASGPVTGTESTGKAWAVGKAW